MLRLYTELCALMDGILLVAMSNADFFLFTGKVAANAQSIVMDNGGVGLLVRVRPGRTSIAHQLQIKPLPIQFGHNLKGKQMYDHVSTTSLN